MILKVTAFWLVVLAALFDCRLKNKQKGYFPCKRRSIQYIIIYVLD